MHKICAHEKCENAHVRKSKYCSDDCRNRQKKLWQNARYKERRKNDEIWAEEQRRKSRKQYRKHAEVILSNRSERRAVDPEYAERLRKSDRERYAKKRINDPDWVEKQKEYHRKRYAEDPVFREQCKERANRNKAKKRHLKNILIAQDVTNKFGEKND